MNTAASSIRSLYGGAAGCGSARQGAISFARGVLIYLGLVGLAVAVNYPGRLVPDSIDQLIQALHPEYLNDWHEPWTIFYWRLFSPLLGEPAAALLAQSLVLLVYPSVLIARAIAVGERSRLSWAFLALFTISLIEVAGQIVKDAMLLGFILCFLALLDGRGFSGRRHWKMALAALMVLAASLIRPVNGFLFAFAGVLAIFAYKVRWQIAVPALAMLAIVSAGQIPFIKFLDARLLNTSHSKVESALMVFDVAGISTNTHTDLFAAIPGWPSQSLARPWDCYTPYYWDPFGWGKCAGYFDKFNAHVANPYAFWVHAILSHPFAYAVHRLRYVHQCFKAMAPIATFHTPYAINVAGKPTLLFGSFTRGLDMRGQFQLWHPSILFWIVEWIAAVALSKAMLLAATAACLLAAWLGVRRKTGVIDNVSLASAGIGIANLMLMAGLGASAAGRYFLPTFFCGFLIVMRMLGGPQRPTGSSESYFV